MPKKIERLFAFVSVDDGSGDEGIIAFLDQTTGTMMPMIGADIARVDSLKPIAEQIKAAMGVNYRIEYFERADRDNEG
jgi:hypothetical protein